MNEKTTKRRIGVSGILLIALIACLALAVASSTAHAASGQPTTRPSVRQVTMIDPFLLKVVAVRDMPSGNVLRSSVTFSTGSPRPTIRIPYRPPVRSAFKPAL